MSQQQSNNNGPFGKRVFVVGVSGSMLKLIVYATYFYVN